MRKLIIEGSLEQFSKIEQQENDDFHLNLIKTFEILQFLRFDAKQLATICRVEFKDPSTRIEDFFDSKRMKIVVLEEEKPGRYTLFIKERAQSSDRAILRTGVYLSDPCIIRDGKIKVGVVGDAKQLRDFIKYVKRMNVDYTVVSSTNPTFGVHSPLESLTDKQRNVITSAFEQGYYDLPRKISSRDLAKKLGLRGSTLIEHRRKAERRLLAGILTTV